MSFGEPIGLNRKSGAVEGSAVPLSLTQNSRIRPAGSAMSRRIGGSYPALPVRKISYPDVFEFHVAASAGVQLQCDLAIE